ncbi:MAG: hypothetical protein PHC66_03435 [Candidatus Nanoarchaeia archaeon]|nr:hypothetical protein [Candidatus Nanoarchaeia archaeon]MDD5239789.1 hypothetical protein [Candidatus Nanoarchaeia archaeon]
MAKIHSFKQAIQIFKKEIGLELVVKKLSPDFPDNVEVLRFYDQGKLYGTMVCVEGEEGLESCCYYGKHPFLDKTPKGHSIEKSLQLIIESAAKPDYPELKDPEICYLRGDFNNTKFLGIDLSEEKVFSTVSGKYMDELKKLRKL